jgi:MOSC domain-containing protein YiiM
MHAFSKTPVECITLLAGLGVAGDAHFGKTVQHRSRVAVNPDAPNLRQVHLLHSELFDELAEAGFLVAASNLGENITTRYLPLLDLPAGTKLHIGASAVVEVTGLRNPCAQIESFRKGLLAAVAHRTPEGTLVRKSGIMGIVLVGGDVRPGDRISVTLPPPPHRRLDRV